MLGDLGKVRRRAVGIGRSRFQATLELGETRVELGDLVAHAVHFLGRHFSPPLERDDAAFDRLERGAPGALFFHGLGIGGSRRRALADRFRVGIARVGIAMHLVALAHELG